MGEPKPTIVTLAEMEPGREADVFLLLSGKEELTTRNGDPYFRVTFRDATREVSFPIWANSPLAGPCRDEWVAGAFYKVRAVLRETNYGPQLEIRRIREATPADEADGFDPDALLPRSRFDPSQMFDELFALVRERIAGKPLRKTVELILTENRETLLKCPAGRQKHHAFVGGLLEHTLNVARTCVYLADKYAEHYAECDPPLDRELVVAGAVLHDIGKLRELKIAPQGFTHTPEGGLIGHLLLGRDMVREAAQRSGLDAETTLRLEHLLVAHQRLPEWGSPKPPMTPEALIVHFADDLDAKLNMMVRVLQDDSTPGPLTSRRNPLGYEIFRGLQ